MSLEKEISRIIELGLEDSDNYPTEKIFSDSMANTIVKLIRRRRKNKK